MPHKILVVCVLALMAMLMAVPSQAANTLGGYQVALDPGHSESETDVGATNEGCRSTSDGEVCETVLEKDVNWYVAVETKKKLEDLGAKVLLTRKQNEYVDRPTRYQRAEEFGAQVLLSIHHNGSSDATVNYTITYYTQQSDQKIAKLAQQHLVAQLGFSDKGTSRNGFGMTVRPKMPSALTEAWFVTNDIPGLADRYVTEKAEAVSSQEEDGEYLDFPERSLVDLEAEGLTDAVVAYFQ